jgi:hypothetical protein
MGHVLARLAGHGVALLGYWPYTFARHPGAPEAVEVTHWRPGGPATAVVDPARPQGADGIVDVGPGPDHPYWVIETTAFKAVWPDGFDVDSGSDPADRTPFYLNGPDDATIYVSGPATIEDPRAALVATYQTVEADRTLAGGVRVLDLTYEHEGETWWQGRYVRPHGSGGRVLVFTAQARAAGRAPARHGLEWMLGLV